MDCFFKTPEGRFNFRVGAIILHQNNLLMVKSHFIPSYYSVGGRVHLHESTDQAVLREAEEETGIRFKIDRLGFIHENFFALEETGEIFHEFCLFYYLTPLQDISKVKRYTVEGSVEEELVWLPIDRLEDFLIYPEFFKTELLAPEYFVKQIISQRT